MDIRLGEWRIDTLTRAAIAPGKERRLSPRAVRMLKVLSEADNGFLAREDLLDAIWPNASVGDESLSKVVSEIRLKLQDPKVIETVPKAGYRIQSSICAPLASGPQLLTSGGFIEAYALCLEARNEIVRCGKGSIENANLLTQDAVAIAPDSAVVRTERSIALVRAHSYWSEGHSFLSTALSEAEAALKIAPDYALAHSAYGFALSRAGHWKAASEAHQTALALSPNDPLVYHNAAWHLMSCGNHRTAIVYFERVSDLEQQNIKGYLVAAQLGQHSDLERSKRNARRALQRSRIRLEADPCDPRALTAEAAALTLVGRFEAGYEAMNRVDVSASSQAFYHASAMATIGELDRAIILLEELVDHGWRDPYWLNADPALNLINDRKFHRLRLKLMPQ